jgi:arylsulfatase A-like enzyme/Flp pilus assembly protein TadD
MRTPLTTALILFSFISCGEPARSLPEKTNSKPPSLLVIGLDTTRADRLGCYGYSNASTPTIDALAEAGALFENVLAHAPLTLPTHASLFTGAFPPEHGIRDNGRTALPKELPTLAETLRDAGLKTGAFIAAFALDATFGLDRGFDVYRDELGPPDANGHEPVQRRGEEVTDDAIAWLNKLGKDDAFFAFVHYYDPHAAYEAPTDFQTTGDAYDDELSYVDSQVKRLMGWLESTRRDSDTIVVLIADHGESLGEHGEPTHGALIYQSTQHVPWIITMPDAKWAGSKISERVQQVDFMPTMLSLYDIAQPPTASGRSLLPLLDGESFGERAMYTESEYCSLNYGWAPLASIVRGKWKLIDAPTPELYDLEADPGELDNLAAQRPDAVESLLSELSELRAGMQDRSGLTIESSSELSSALEALGYAGAQPSPASADGRNPVESIALLARYNEAVEFGHSGEYEKMVPLLEEIVAECPGPIGFRSTLASGYLELDRAPEAIVLLEAVLAENPTYEPAHVYAGRAQLRLGDLDRALAHFRANLSQVPGSWRVQLPVAQILTVQEKHEEALVAWRRMVELQPDDPSHHMRLAEAWREVGRWDGMVESLRRAHSMTPEDHGVSAYLSWTLSTAPVAEVRDGVLAVRLAEQAIKAGETADRFDTLGAALAETGKYQAAVEAVLRAIELLPPDAEELRKEYELRLALYRSGRPFHHR